MAIFSSLRFWLAIGAVAAVIFAAYSYGEQRFAAGKAACEAEHAEAAAKAAEQVAARDTAAADVNTNTAAYLWGALPPIELRSHETRERVRTIYRDRPVLAGACVRPDGVQAELDAARARAIAAGSPVRPIADGRDPADSAAGGNGRLGPAGAGDPRGGSDEGGGLASLRTGPP